MAKLTCVFFFLTLTALSSLSYTSGRVLSETPTPDLDCSEAPFLMMDCLDYVVMGSNSTKPLASCCTGVSSVGKMDPDCLCAALDAAKGFGLTLNMTVAINLPNVCSVNIPKNRHCPADSPSPSSAPQPQGSPAEATSAATPLPSEINGASTLMSSIMMVVVSLIFAGSSSFF